MPKICFQMIVLDGLSDYVLAECLQSVLPYGPVIATEGPVKFWQDHPLPSDRTNEILDHFNIPTIHGKWAEKDEMVNAKLSRVPPDTEFI